MTGAVRGTVEDQQPTAFEGAVHDRLGQIMIMEDCAPRGQRRLVGREDDRPLLEVAVVDHMEEDIGGIEAVGKVADLIDDEHVRLKVVQQTVAQAAIAAGGGEIIDQRSGSSKKCGEAVLNGAIGDRDRQMRLAAPGLAHEDQVAAFGDEVGAEVGAQQRGTDGGLLGEVEVVDGLEEREMGIMRCPAQARAVAVSDFLGQHGGQEITMRPPLGAGLLGELWPAASGIGQVQPLERSIDVEGGRIEGDHGRTSKSSGWVRPSARATKSTEMLCTSRAARKARSIASGPTAWRISCS